MVKLLAQHRPLMRGGYQMADASQYVFSFQELAELLVKRQNIHEGLWSVTIKFGIQAGHIAGLGAPLLPTALVPVLEIGIQKVDKANELTVDAAKVNPQRKSRKGRQQQLQ